MHFRVEVELITGFISSGKTKFINYLLDETWIEGERILIIQCEKGNTEIMYNSANNCIHKKSLSSEEGLSINKIKSLIALYSPHRIIIEQNGTENIEGLLDLFSSKELIKLCTITTIFHMIDGATYDIFYNNMASILIPALSMSNMILINNTNSISKATISKIKNSIEKKNLDGFIIVISDINRLKEELPGDKLLDKGLLKKVRFFFKNI